MTERTERSTFLAAVVDAAADVAATRARSAKTARLAELLRGLDPTEAVPAVGLLLGRPAQRRLGIGWRTASAARPAPADTAALTVLDVDAAFARLAQAHGPGSASVRSQTLDGLMSRATVAEQDYLLRVLVGEVRTGALEGVLTDAAAAAADLPVAEVRRAAMLSGDLGQTVRATLAGDDVSNIDLTPGVAVSPMLASSASTASEAVTGIGPAAVEVKLDGARIQVHRVDGRVRVYTRSLADITDRVPEIVTVVAAFPGGDLVLDGETLALDAAGAPRPFQDTMSRFGTDSGNRSGGDDLDGDLSAWFFDVLHANGASLIDEPLSTRRAVLAEIVGDRLIRGIEVAGDDAAVHAEQFFAEAVASSNEGVVVKGLDSVYAAGRRGSHWIKVKPVHTFDLVVLAVEQGSGRRTGMLSNLHLGARDPAGRYGPPSDFVMVGKTFKGLTDEILRWQTDYFPSIATSVEAHVTRVRPETVVEIAIDGVQRSQRYPGGLALRFARVRRYRVGPDGKDASEADTIDALSDLLRR